MRIKDLNSLTVCGNSQFVTSIQRVASLAAFICIGNTSDAQTGTFIDRHDQDDVRVVSYNVNFESIFTVENPVQAAKFDRVVNALKPDILNLQEIRQYTAGDVVTLLNTIAPLGGTKTWYAHQGDDNVIASRFPLTKTATNTIPEKDGTGIALVDLPDSKFVTDMYVMNNHFTCCNQMEPPGPLDPRELARQNQADALVNWMRDARTPGGFVDLTLDTPMLVVGDLNIINEPGELDPLGTLMTGNIYNEVIYGPDSPPDWDGTSLADAEPLHNARRSDTYTWRNDLSPFDPGRLDYVLYTDSVLGLENSFVLNTVDMTPIELQATGLQPLDVTFDEQFYDHLPVVTDFRVAQVPEPSSVVCIVVCAGPLLIRRRHRSL